MVDPKQFSDAVWSGDLATVKAMIADGANVNAADALRDAPLHLAIEQMFVEIARCLLDAGADVNLTSGGWTPLEHAIDIESDSAWQTHNELGHESTRLSAVLLAAGAAATKRAIQIAQDYNNRKALELLGLYTLHHQLGTPNDHGTDP